MPRIPLSLSLSSRDITDTRVRPGGHWVSAVVSNPSPQGSETRLVMWPVERPDVDVVLLDHPQPATGRGLSGGAHVWDRDGECVFIVTQRDGIVVVSVQNDELHTTRQLPFDINRSWSTPAWEHSTRTLYAIADWTELWACQVDGGEPWCVYRADAFAMDATAGSGGRCVTWKRPHMVWTESWVFPEVVRTGVAVQQPRFSTTGKSFGYVDDARGVNNVRVVADHIVDHDVVIEDECEHGGPTWGPGQRTWCFNSDGTRVAYTRNEKGFGSLWVYDRVTNERFMIGRAVHGCVSWEGDTIAALRTGARTPTQVVMYNVADLAHPVRTIGSTSGDDAWRSPEYNNELVEPSLHEAEGDGVVVPYRLYRAPTPSDAVIVWVHGGPTDQWQVTFRPRIPLWTSRGWSVVVVDHRGTTGHGRAYMESLHGYWGERDAIDTAAVVQHVQQEFGFAPTRTVLMGGSAGGLSALNCAVRVPERVAGLVLSYPVVDLDDIMNGDDPFETHYMPQLLGAQSPDDSPVQQRSPLSRADRLVGIPILIFHGDRDVSVPLQHSLKLQEAVSAAGGTVQVEVMEGEGHGFKDTQLVLRELSLTESFLDRL